MDSNSLAETILQSLDNIEDLENSYLYLNFADTLVEPLIESEKDLIYYDKVDYTSRWTSFSKNGEINSITEKFSDFSNESKNVFTGVFGISDPREFREKLEEVMEKDTELSPFFSALTNYLKEKDY